MEQFSISKPTLIKRFKDLADKNILTKQHIKPMFSMKVAWKISKLIHFSSVEISTPSYEVVL